MASRINIIKASGVSEPFIKEKLLNSIRKSGASDVAAGKALTHIENELRDGMSTGQIYNHAFDVLKRLEQKAARSYSLRRAIAGLGPTGFPFERFISEIMKKKGFQTAVGEILLGRCVEHEIDVVAWNDKKLVMIETKFHNEIGVKTDLKVSLYVKARYDDLSENQFDFGGRRFLDEGWLVTNTKFTSNAIKFGKCANLNLIGWSYPSNGNLQNLVEDFSLQPITVMTTLKSGEIKQLLDRGIVLCGDLRRAELLRDIGIGHDRIGAIITEAETC